ncbi:hypothetical protein [Ralstonia sp. ASV6]|uniref:hypothetical protein n=1 Tax=Ralstonia sp. ASV6 TaxID=2795124 RepID=UPI0018EBDF5B|nr:hypothetical protein [Ralstonia sp. ASV6]
MEALAVVEHNTIAVEIVQLLQRCRFDLSTEKHLQAGVEQALRGAGFDFAREKRLSSQDIPDFLVSGGVVIECKMRNKSSKMEVFRQISRYAEHAEVTAIILASNMSMGLPPELNGKPLYSASLSRGWL